MSCTIYNRMNTLPIRATMFILYSWKQKILAKSDIQMRRNCVYGFELFTTCKYH